MPRRARFSSTSTTSGCSSCSAAKGRLIRAFYYTALLDDQEYSPIRPLVDWLDYNGYTMVTKPTKEFTDAMGRRKIKGNMDIELAIDVMEMAQYLDHIVLFSGDGDFRRLVEAVQRKGVRVTVVSTIRSQPPMVADELRRQADTFVELQDLAPQIMRAHHREPQAARDVSAAPGAPAPMDPARLPALPAPRRLPRRAARALSRLAQCARAVLRRRRGAAAVVGLAPGLKGANRTGRPFTGDYAGDLLYATLGEVRFRRAATMRRAADDGLALVDCRITNAVRCVPPENKPEPAEIAPCRGFLAAEIAAMSKLRVDGGAGRHRA